MHTQSIQMYSMSIHRTVKIASCNVRGNVLKPIAISCACKLIVVVFEGKSAPQQ